MVSLNIWDDRNVILWKILFCFIFKCLEKKIVLIYLKLQLVGLRREWT